MDPVQMNSDVLFMIGIAGCICVAVYAFLNFWRNRD